MSSFMSPRKIAAGTTDGGNFGVGKIANPITHPDRNMDSGKSLADAQRSTGPAVSRGTGKMGAERNSDHGPHNHPAGAR